MVKFYVVYGLGIGCHEEAAHAFRKAGAEAETVHIRALLSGEKKLDGISGINFSGGFLHGDMLGAGMCAANELEHAVVDGRRFKDTLLEFVEKGGIIYGQCNGFQLLVKTGLLPGINRDYSKQTVTLTNNDCGDYFVSPALHITDRQHFAFNGIEPNDLYLWCRHGEGKVVFWSEAGSIPKEEGERARRIVNERHVLLRYAEPATMAPTQKFPFNPNGSVDAIAGLVDPTGRVFAHMAHSEVAVYRSRDPRWFSEKDALRRLGTKAESLDEKVLEGVGLKVFQNIVQYCKGG